MTIQELLRSMHGVWHGTYTTMAPDGTVIEHFASQQEGRMEGTDWTEKVIYRKPGGRVETRSTGEDTEAENGFTLPHYQTPVGFTLPAAAKSH